MQFQKARGSGVLTGAPSGHRIDEAVTQRRPPGGLGTVRPGCRPAVRAIAQGTDMSQTPLSAPARVSQEWELANLDRLKILSQ